ncbi:unnamed protein product [Debaryomyces tyrocola]|nr:unnamed protein product [Debaryomyces tyrocola]
MHEVSRLRSFLIALLLSIHQFDVMKKFDVKAENSVLGPLRLRTHQMVSTSIPFPIYRGRGSENTSYIIYLLSKILIFSRFSSHARNNKPYHSLQAKADQPSTKYGTKLSLTGYSNQI